MGFFSYCSYIDTGDPAAVIGVSGRRAGVGSREGLKKRKILEAPN